MVNQTKISKLILALLFILSLLATVNVFSQEEDEGDAVMQRNAWFYIQRAHPYDTIPSLGYGNAIAQKNQLISNYGYHLAATGSSWVNIGPQPLNGIGGIVSGRVVALTYDKRILNGNTVYIAPAGGGVWKTTDAGSSWLNICSNLPTLVSGALAIDYNHNIIYYGSGTNHIFGTEYMGMGIFKSTNDGQSWDQISFGLPQHSQIFKIVIDPNDTTGNTILLGDFHGLYKTTNGGGNWYKILPTNASDLMCTDVCFSPNGSKVYAVGTASDFWPGSIFNGIGYYRSTDGGVNFTKIESNSGFPHSSIPHGRTCIAVSKASEDTVYFSSYDNAGVDPVYIYKSTNGGLNFSSYHYPYVSEWDNWDLGGNAGFNQTLSCSDFDPDVIIIGMQNLYKSTNGGTVWTCIGGYCNGYPHADFHTIGFDPFDQNSNKVFVGSDGGVFKSDNRGSSWTGLNEALSFSQVWHVGSNTYNSDVVAAGIEDQDLAYKQQGTNWIDIGFGYDGGLVSPSPFIGGRSIANTCADRKMFFATNGMNFDYASNYLQSTTTGSWIAVVANSPVVPGNSYLLRYEHYVDSLGKHYFSPVHLLRTTNYGASYNGGSDVSFAIDWINVAPNSIAISQSNPDFMLMSIGNSSPFWHEYDNAYSRLIRSTDGGLTWNTGAPILSCDNQVVPDRFLTHVEIDPKNEQEIYVTLSGYDAGHVYRTTNGGTNWNNITSNIPDNPVNDLIIHYTSSNTKELIVACDVGVFRTDATNISWSPLALDLPNAPVLNLDYNRLSGKLNCATLGRSVWQVQLDGTENAPGPIYVQDRLYITDNLMNQKAQIVVCNGGEVMLGHSAMNTPFTMNFEDNANILVLDSGHLATAGTGAVTLTSSNSWPGIEFQGTGYGSLYNCTFENTTTPITINPNPGDGPGSNNPPQINISYCTFKKGPVVVNNRGHVFIDNCLWDYTSASNSSVVGVAAVGSSNVTVQWSTINYPTGSNSVTGISAIQSSGIVISHNTITNTALGIMASNCDPNIRFNKVITTGGTATIGIGVDQCSNPVLFMDTVIAYITGFNLNNGSSPVMHDNYAVNSISYGMFCDNSSSPRMTPTIENGIVYWDAGLNVLETTTDGGSGIWIGNSSIPNMTNGYNTTWGGNCYIDGSGSGRWSIINNCWLDDPPVSGKFCVTGFQTLTRSPYSCSPPPGAGAYSNFKNMDRREEIEVT